MKERERGGDRELQNLAVNVECGYTEENVGSIHRLCHLLRMASVSSEC